MGRNGRRAGFVIAAEAMAHDDSMIWLRMILAEGRTEVNVRLRIHRHLVIIRKCFGLFRITHSNVLC